MHPDEITLFNACTLNRYCSSELVVILRRGVNVNKVNMSGRAPLHWAAENNDEKLVSLLLDYKADIEARNAAGQTALHLAVSCSSYEVINLLIARGANIEAQDKYGGTPLHWAAHRGDLSTIRLLVKAGACITSKNHAGLTPIQFAYRLNNHDVARALIEVSSSEYYTFNRSPIASASIESNVTPSNGLFSVFSTRKK